MTNTIEMHGIQADVPPVSLRSPKSDRLPARPVTDGWCCFIAHRSGNTV